MQAKWFRRLIVRNALQLLPSNTFVLAGIQPLGGLYRKVWTLNCEGGTEDGLITYYYILVKDRLLAPSANLCFLHELKANKACGTVELPISKANSIHF
jgi:hypothetical protein